MILDDLPEYEGTGTEIPYLGSNDYAALGLILVSLVLALISVNTAFRAMLTPSRRRSLNLVGVLLAGFLILIVLTPQVRMVPWLGIILFLGVLGLFKLMSQFETPD
jgi:predicted membrane channel-forming protein YqfA (hemolysin III family)